MAYEPFQWQDGRQGGTPITAERLNHIEQGVGSAASAAESAAPANHTHEMSDVTGLAGALDSKQDAGDYALANHTHSMGDVEGLADALGDKADLSYVQSEIARLEGLINDAGDG